MAATTTATKPSKNTQGVRKHDWALILGGIALAIVGFIIAGMPGATLVALAIVGGVFLIAAGIIDFITYARIKDYMDGSGWVLANGVLDVILGVVFLAQPIATAFVLPFLAGIFVGIYGIFAIAMSVQMKALPGSGWGWSLASGILSIICGIGFVVFPELFAFFVAVWMVVRGITMAVYGFTAPQAYDYL